VRTHPPVDRGDDDDAWQHAALPAQTATYAEQVLADSLGTGRDVIPLDAGFPGDELLPRAELAALAAEVADRTAGALQYLQVEGVPELRGVLADHGVGEGRPTDPEEVVVTTGARQAIDLVARAILQPGDVAVVESPGFTGTLTSLQNTGARVLPLPVDGEGPDVAALERLLARHEVNVDPEELDEGVRRLARTLRAVRRRQPMGATSPLS
jgi:DNA-binding transcriptional MocR family regulator